MCNLTFGTYFNTQFLYSNYSFLAVFSIIPKVQCLLEKTIELDVPEEIFFFAELRTTPQPARVYGGYPQVGGSRGSS